VVYHVFDAESKVVTALSASGLNVTVALGTCTVKSGAVMVPPSTRMTVVSRWRPDTFKTELNQTVLSTATGVALKLDPIVLTVGTTRSSRASTVKGRRRQRAKRDIEDAPEMEE